MNSDKISMTKDGLDQLKAELEARRLKLREVADKIDEARQQGDLSENAAYSSALAEKELQEAKIKELEDKISNAVVVSGDSKNDIIEMGEKVKVRKVSDGSIFEYMIVGETEADPSSNKISASSPLGMALVNKKIGDKVKVDMPSGEEEFVIEKVG